MNRRDLLILSPIAVVGAFALLAVYVNEHMGYDDIAVKHATVWLNVWTCILAVTTVATLFIVYRSFTQAQFFERTKLTVDTLNNTQLQSATQQLGFLLERNGFNLTSARSFIDAGVTPPPTSADVQLYYRVIREIPTAMQYIATLYSQDILVNSALIPYIALNYVVAYYALNTMMVRAIGLGMIPKNVQTLGKACLDYVRTTPTIFQQYPELQSYNI